MIPWRIGMGLRNVLVVHKDGEKCQPNSCDSNHLCLTKRRACSHEFRKLGLISYCIQNDKKRENEGDLTQVTRMYIPTPSNSRNHSKILLILVEKNKNVGRVRSTRIFKARHELCPRLKLT
ncbi:hypothetical protein Mapa_017757 [Marchantia paleacea]|nr:hypothetical protein Mapa_017757 [Marchantia paleacea]